MSQESVPKNEVQQKGSNRQHQEGGTHGSVAAGVVPDVRPKSAVPFNNFVQVPMLTATERFAIGLGLWLIPSFLLSHLVIS
jgi:hypothetical protein